jgi:hypothetical protein
MSERALLVLLLLVALGCASDPADREAVARAEATRMAAPEEPLSSFGHFELAPLAFSADAEFESDEKKVAQARILEGKLRARLQPLLDGWNASASASLLARDRTLIIEPTLQQLRIVSGGARFWAGAMAGDSIIDLDLKLVDLTSGERIGQARVMRGSGAMAGGWSVGATDRNLLDYIVDICHEYLVHNYTR